MGMGGRVGWEVIWSLNLRHVTNSYFLNIARQKFVCKPVIFFLNKVTLISTSVELFSLQWFRLVRITFAKMEDNASSYLPTKIPLMNVLCASVLTVSQDDFVHTALMV